MIKEDGKFYPMMKAVRNNSGKKTVYTEEEAWFGPLLLEKRHPVLKEYLLREEMIRKKILAGLSGAESVSAKTRLAEVKEEMELIHTALKRYEAYELIEWLNEHHPQKFAEDWDNVGLLVGDDQKEISHVFLALDLTEPVLDEAVASGADMILTHHPMIFSGIKKINNHTFTGRKILRLIKEDIPYFAMHTNYDVIGMADLSADHLKLQDTRVLTVTDGSGGAAGGIRKSGKASPCYDSW